MGCWNETCVLTGLPIHHGAPVVALTAVYGPQYKIGGGTTLKTDLLFGVPQVGAYDDYGGIEDLANPEVAALHEKAFAGAGYYKKHDLKLSYGSPETWWLAAHADTLWGLTSDIKGIYYPELGVRLSDERSYDEAARAKTSEAHKRADEALAKLGTALGAATFEGQLEDAQNKLFAIFEDVFGKELAWPAWNAIRSEGLYASRGELFMHQTAYQAMVQEFGKRKVGYYNDSKRYALRDYIASQLDDFLASFPVDYKEVADMFSGLKDESSDFEKQKRILRYTASRKYSILAPITSMWMAPELPIIGHFWGGASLDEIMAVVPRDTLIDYFVFQWARHYLRKDFTKPGGGSQNGEVVLPHKIFQATMKMLRTEKRARTDFYGTLHR